VSYPPDFLAALAEFGLAPRPGTDPLFVREALDALYRYELRRVRDDLVAGRLAKPDYHGVIVALRKKYWLLTLPASAWQRICSVSTSAGS
jgi:hypothetical protein